MNPPPPALTQIRYRPRRLSRFILRDAAGQLAPAVIDWMAKQPVVPKEERELPDPPEPGAIPGILEKALFCRDGYEIARHLQLLHFIAPDADLVAILAAAPSLLTTAFEKAWQQWLRENGLGPITPGTKVHYVRRRDLGLGEVISNDDGTAESIVTFPHIDGQLPEPGIPCRWEHLEAI